jgi:hypothetical protein
MLFGGPATAYLAPGQRVDGIRLSNVRRERAD